MRKKHADLFLGIFMLLLFALLADRGVLRVSETSALPESAPPVVVIDSGHGGDDPGKVGIIKINELIVRGSAGSLIISSLILMILLRMTMISSFTKRNLIVPKSWNSV